VHRDSNQGSCSLGSAVLVGSASSRECGCLYCIALYSGRYIGRHPLVAHPHPFHGIEPGACPQSESSNTAPRNPSRTPLTMPQQISGRATQPYHGSLEPQRGSLRPCYDSNHGPMNPRSLSAAAYLHQRLRQPRSHSVRFAPRPLRPRIRPRPVRVAPRHHGQLSPARHARAAPSPPARNPVSDAAAAAAFPGLRRHHTTVPRAALPARGPWTPVTRTRTPPPPQEPAQVPSRPSLPTPRPRSRPHSL
jgi:hypothetical protein